LRRLFTFYPREGETAAHDIRASVRQRSEQFAALGPIVDEDLARRLTSRR
jgi:hypothetical protein